jgi:hypothetical protein
MKIAKLADHRGGRSNPGGFASPTGHRGQCRALTEPLCGVSAQEEQVLALQKLVDDEAKMVRVLPPGFGGLAHIRAFDPAIGTIEVSFSSVMAHGFTRQIAHMLGNGLGRIGSTPRPALVRHKGLDHHPLRRPHADGGDPASAAPDAQRGAGLSRSLRDRGG